MKGMNMPGHDMSQMSAQDLPREDSDASMHAMHSMEGHHMDMGPHMKMTALRTPQPGDAEKAQKVVEAARGVMEKYKDYHVALNENFKIFHPEVPQKQYHFTNYRYAWRQDRIQSRASDLAALRKKWRRLPSGGRDVHGSQAFHRRRFEPAHPAQHRAVA